MTPQQFAAAHDRYLQPPDDKDIPECECGDCSGTGEITDEETGDMKTCPQCEGNGTCQMTKDQIADEKQYYDERKAEAKAEELRDMKIGSDLDRFLGGREE